MKLSYFLKLFFPILATLIFVAFYATLLSSALIKNSEIKLSASVKDVVDQPNIKEDIFKPKNASWKKILDSAPFDKRDSQGVVVFLDKLWVLGGVGGIAPVYFPNYNDVWNSADGKNWVRVLENAPWPARRSHGAVVFKDKIWIFGGVGDNDKYLNDVWSSEDGVNWQKITGSAQWTPRKGLSAAVFKDKIWVLGGIDSKNARNDVWYSENGKDWVLAEKEAPWSSRLGLVIEVFDGKLWLSGGNYPNEMGQTDVWSSEDGVNWKFVAEAPWPGRHCHCFVLYNGYLWVIGGWSGYAHGYNDVWFSKDGANWENLIKDKSGPWKGREDLSCVEFQEKIFMLSGMKTNGERMNDVWYLN